MTQEHPITPPPELLKQWVHEFYGGTPISPGEASVYIATQAARWGADQELEACLQWFSTFYCMETWMQKDLEKFSSARRPKPPSLKDQAIETLHMIRDHLPADMYEKTFLIRSALESLPS